MWSIIIILSMLSVTGGLFCSKKETPKQEGYTPTYKDDSEMIWDLTTPPMKGYDWESTV